MDSTAYRQKRNWIFTFLRCIGRFPLKHGYWPGSVLKAISVPGVIWSAILTVLCFIGTQPLVLLVKWLVFDLKLEGIQLSIGLALLTIEEVMAYLMYFSWIFLLPNIVRCTEKIARFDEAYWYLMDGGKWHYLVLLKSFVFWILLSCWVSMAVLTFFAHRWMTNFSENHEQLWIFIVAKNKEITTDLSAALGFYLQIVNCISYAYYFGMGHALNYRIKLLASHVETKGLAHYVVKAMKVSPRDKIHRVDLGLWRLREMMMRLTDIYEEFTNATQFVVLVKTVCSTLVGCLMIYFLYISVDIYKLLHGLEPVTVYGMGYFFLVTMVEIFILANSGEALYQNGKRLKNAILRCPNISDIDGGSSADFKQMVGTMDFPLSGCGYVNVDRGTITSIFSVIATYFIVLFQMNPKAPVGDIPS